MTDPAHITAQDSWLAAIVDSSDDAIIGKNLAGIITSWNKGAERMFGYAAAEAVGKPIAMIADPGRIDEMPNILERIKSGQRIDHYETVRRTKDGRQVHVSLTVSPVYDRTGQIIGASKIARDITERKLAEAEIAKQSMRMVRANADLQQFAYITSHDLKEPLRTVSISAEMLLRKSGEKLNAEERQLLEFVITSARRMNSMIADLLPYARTLTEDLPLADVKTSESLDWAINNLHAAIQASNAEIHYDREFLPTVRGNKIALVQLFQNLLSNAIKYRSAERPKVEVSAVRQDGGWLFTVRDNGIGIAPAYHQRVFTLFQRLHTGEYPGTGVGLSLCRKIVQAHGGEIWVESDQGQGAAFKFRLGDGEER
ncbi:MAG: hypothetical protein DMG59_05135 [Acidobacteria bacterium]|nr:MAG: hypothetical protein DMG59_05135 [Acidobacteriota bacterium]